MRGVFVPMEVGREFDQLTVISLIDNQRCLVGCTCGKVKVVYKHNLVSGNTGSCHNRPRPQNFDPILRLIYRHMLQRCYDSRHVSYANYGGRGIGVCKRWLNSFDDFCSDVGQRPTPKHSLDRYPNNNGNYESGNVRWATAEEQSLNTRRNRRVNLNGENLTVSQWAERLGINRSTLYKRLNRSGWNPLTALQTPVVQDGRTHV